MAKLYIENGFERLKRLGRNERFVLKNGVYGGLFVGGNVLADFTHEFIIFVGNSIELYI